MSPASRLRAMSRLVAAVLSVALLSACASAVDDTGDDGFISGNGEITFVDPGERKPAPELSGTDLDGNEISSADFAGQVIVVNLWGSWCPPCRKEAPALKEVADELADQKVQFLGLLTQDNPAAARSFNAKVGITYPSIDDGDGTNQAAFADSLPALAIPTTWIIDANGEIAVRAMDELTAPTLRGLIEQTQKSTR